MKAVDVNQEAYNQMYSAGYGVSVPESNIIRIYKHIIEYELKLTSGKVLDFGTGNGVHMAWLKTQGKWSVAGVDTNSAAINLAQKQIPEDAKSFHVVKNYPILTDLYKESFDLIIANQVLYYLDNEELKHVTNQFMKILRPGGVFYASMMGIEHNYFTKSKPKQDSDFRIVKLSGRCNETTEINFKSREQMMADFNCFERVHVGYYDTIIREDEGRTLHHFFVGKKPR